jgi:ABC-type branched-subunit amino acid transport system ATPase component
MTIILVEQQIERALDFADEVLILERRRNAWCGTASRIARRPDYHRASPRRLDPARLSGCLAAI